MFALARRRSVKALKAEHGDLAHCASVPLEHLPDGLAVLTDARELHAAFVPPGRKGAVLRTLLQYRDLARPETKQQTIFPENEYRIRI